MARRGGRRGAYLATDDYTGFTVYANQLQEDYWGNRVVRELKRNLQEIASPLADPYPVPFYRGPTYEPTTACQFELQPTFIGTTNIPFPNTDVTQLFNLNPSLGQMEVGCTFIVR